MELSATAIDGLFVARFPRSTDHRGSFGRWFCGQQLQSVLQGRQLAQINHSFTAARGALRGLHFQRPPHGEMKLVRCIKGSVWDIAVDLRKGSPTFLRWHAEEITAENERMMVIPEGFAHGFQTLAPAAELLYLHTHPYTPAAEGGLAYDEVRLNISWPLPPIDISLRDQQHNRLSADFSGMVV